MLTIYHLATLLIANQLKAATERYLELNRSGLKGKLFESEKNSFPSDIITDRILPQLIQETEMS